MKFKIGNKVKIINNSCSHSYSIGEEYYIRTIHRISPSRYFLSYRKNGVNIYSYVTNDDIILANKHICGLICDCNAREAVSF